MKPREIGMRVGAISHANDQTVFLFGYGVYDGYHPCPLLDGHDNPRLTMDDGTVVWGMECWWGGEAAIEQSIGDRRVEIVKPDRTSSGEGASRE